LAGTRSIISGIVLEADIIVFKQGLVTFIMRGNVFGSPKVVGVTERLR
jgi:hypothetical protein